MVGDCGTMGITDGPAFLVAAPFQLTTLKIAKVPDCAMIRMPPSVLAQTGALVVSGR